MKKGTPENSSQSGDEYSLSPLSGLSEVIATWLRSLTPATHEIEADRIGDHNPLPPLSLFWGGTFRLALYALDVHWAGRARRTKPHPPKHPIHRQSSEPLSGMIKGQWRCRKWWHNVALGDDITLHPALCWRWGHYRFRRWLGPRTTLAFWRLSTRACSHYCGSVLMCVDGDHGSAV